MSLTKYTKSEAILEVKTASQRIEFGPEALPGDGFNKFAALQDEGVNKGYLYVRTRAISSRINKNNDSWPSEELAKSYKTFIGRPVFVDHNNDNPKRARGVVIDSRLHVEDDEKTSALDSFYGSDDAEDLHKPPTWIELLLEVDARTFPKLATAIRKGWIDSTSMGANIEYSSCNICGNRAENPQEYCFIPGTKVLMADFSYKNIEDVKIFDEVIADDGSIGRVIDTMSRDYKGPIVTLWRDGSSHSITATSNHKVFANISAREMTTSVSGKIRYEPVHNSDNWEDIRIDQLQIGDWVKTVYPTDIEYFMIDLSLLGDFVKRGDKVYPSGRVKTRWGKRNGLPRFIEPTSEFLFVTGLYLAEGSIAVQNNKPYLIEWTFSAEEQDVVNKLVSSVDKIGAGNCRVYHSSNKIIVKIANEVLATLLIRLCGQGARSKVLCEELMLLDPILQEELFNAYFVGDGYKNDNHHIGRTVVTASDILARQLTILAHRIWGNPGALCRVENSGGPTNRNKRNTINRVIVNSSKYYQRSLDRNTCASRIRKITHEEYKGKVYNFTVGHQHTYVVENIAVHNCSHVKTKGTPFEVTSSDGHKHNRKAAEHCYGINFFEDSFVFDPADPTALITEKKGKIAEVGGIDQPYPVLKEDEGQRVWQWRYDEFIRMGFPPEVAEDMANRAPNNLEPGFDLHDVENYVTQQPGQHDFIYKMLSKHYPKASEWKRTDWNDHCPNCGKQAEKVLKEAFDDDNLYSCHSCSKNFRAEKKSSVDPLDQIRIVALDQLTNPADVEHERQLNYEPQSQMTTAPEEVDTLRKDYKCPNCKSDYMIADPDGLLRCQTCSYVTPPHPLDNPDLSARQKTDIEQDEQERSQLPTDIDQMIDQIRIQPKDKTQQGGPGVSPVSPINPINQMASTKGINRMKWTTVSNHASVDTFIGNEDGITFETYKALQERNLTAKVKYPTGEESTIPFGNPIRDMVLGLRAQRYANLNNVGEVPITVEADLKDIDEVLEIIHTATAPIKKKIINPSTKSKTEDPQNAKIISDATAPVTSAEKEADRRRIRRSEEDQNGIRRTEEIVEETSDSVSPYSDMSEEPQEEEQEQEETENEYATAAARENRTLVAFSLAEELVELGALDPSHKLAFVSEVEKENEEQIKARKATIELLKKNFKPAPKTGARLPKFSSFAKASAEDEPIDNIDDITFDAIFLS